MIKQRLEEARTKKINFKFLKSVDSYVNENYKEIKESLTNREYSEVLTEINRNTDLVHVSGGNEITLISAYYSSDRAKDEPATANIRSSHLKHSLNVYKLLSLNEKVNIDTLYYVSDQDKFIEYILSEEDKENKIATEDYKKRLQKRRDIKEEIAKDIKEFNLTIANLDQLEDYRNARTLRDKDIPLKDLVNTISTIAYEAC